MAVDLSKYDKYLHVEVSEEELRQAYAKKRRKQIAEDVASTILHGGRMYPGTPRLGKYNHHLIKGVRVK